MAGSLEILISQWERLLLRGWRGRRRAGEEKEGERVVLNAAPLCYCAAVVGGDERRAESLSEVTHGWMFIFRAANYLTAALTVCVRARVRVCHYLSQSQGDVACCPLHTTEFTKRAVCTERDQS